MHATSANWKALLPAAGLVLLTACAGPRLEVATAPSQPGVTLTEVGIRLDLLPNTWSGYPGDLSRYYTPIEVRIQNDRTDEIQVRYGDFLAVDEAQNQYRAVAPGEVVRALFGSLEPDGHPGRDGPAGIPRGPLLAWRGPWWPYPYRLYGSWYPFYPYYLDPLYYDYPYGWSRPTGYDILTRGLREGRVLPQARVEGYLYLQQATRRGDLLTLSWTPASPDGKALATLSSQFRVVR
jgi:hypothetical protein